MCGGKSTTQQTTTIPPEVLARYNAVNAYAENVAQQPFQRYTGQFVAPINEQQMMGISGINNAANMAQPYFNQATQALGTAYNQASPYYGQSLQSLSGGMNQANQLYGTALSGISNAVNIGSQYGTDATRFFNQASNASSPLMSQATNFVNTGLGAAAPLYAQSQQYLKGGTQAVNAEDFGAGQVQKYMSPYMAQVVEAQQKLQEQQNAQQRSALNSQAIGAGAFGGDRSGIAQANLAGQQSLANQATMSNLLQQGYGQALGAFQQQQGVNLQAQQANRAAQQFGQQAAANLAQQQFGQNLAASQQMGNLGQALFGQQMTQGQALAALGQQLYAQNLGASQAQAGIAQNQFGMSAQQAQMMQQAAQGMFGMGSQYASGLAGLGTGAQTAALQGSQAQIGAGTLMQQTQQAQDTAKYQEFLQERGYPFQVAQFLANIAMGTGALSGSTTTTTSPNAFFSDRRLKKDIKEIGETHDGLPIYSFKYKGGDDLPRIGVMADEAREKHPDAVKRVGGVDAVDYEKIANRASEGGGVMPHRAGEGFAEGGHVSPEDLSAIIAMQKQFLGPYAQGGLYSQSSQNLPGGKGVVPLASLPVSRLSRHAPPPQQQSGAQQVMAGLGQTNQLGETIFGDKGLVAKGKQAYNYFKSPQNAAKENQPAGGSSAAAPQAQSSGVRPQGGASNAKQQGRIKDYSEQKQVEAAPDAGGIKPRTELAMDQSITPADEDIFMPSQYSARGGVVPHKSKGGTLQEKILPYQSEDPYGVEAVNEAESGEKYDLLGEDEGKKSGSGGGKGGSPALKLGLKAASLGANLIPGVGPFLSAGLGAASSMFNEGGAVPRVPFEDGGEAKQDRLRNYYDYMVSKGEPSHVAAGIVGNIAKESAGNPEAWGDNDNSFGLFQKNIRGELPAYEKWAQENKRNMKDPYSQIDHVLDQLRGAHSKTYQQMLESNDPAKAAYQFAVGYERPVPATANYEGRMAVARQYAGGVSPEGGVEGYIQSNYPKDDGRRRSAAPAQYEGGVETVDGKPVQKGVGNPMEYRTGKPFESVGDFLTSRQFLVPLLSGVGAMAASPSRYFGGALLQGVGAAAQSYANMERPITEGEQQRAATETQRGATEEVYRRIANQSMNVDPTTGIILGVNVYVNGKPTQVSVREYNKALKEGRPYALDPRGQVVAREPIQEATAGERAAPGAPGAPVGTVQATGPAYKAIDPSTAKLVTQNAESIGTGGQMGLSPNDVELNPFLPAGRQSRDSLMGLTDRNAYASAFASLGKENLGAFSTQIVMPTSNYVNSVIRKANGTFGTSIPEIMPDQLGDSDVINKLATQLASLKDQNTGQKSYASFAQWLSAVPTTMNNPEAVSKLIADIYVQNQINIDKNRYLNNAKNYAIQQGYVNENQAQYIGRGLEENYIRSTSKQYAQEKQQLSKMLYEPLEIKNPKTGQVEQSTLIGYLAKSNGYAPPALLKVMQSKGYSPELLRYFGGQ